jgi:hypothetical protein
MIDVSTRTWIIATLTGYILLAIWVASILTNPIVHIDSTVQGTIFLIALGALGISNVTGFQTIKAVQASRE